MTTTSTNRPRHLSVVSSICSPPDQSARLTDPALWECIRAFEFDEPGTTLTFARRLARENGWTAAHARRVIDEYRRFVYLAMVSPHAVSPSEDVDQAWHLHMVYTRSYWEDLCAKVLGRPLHHGPTRGGTREQTKFVDLYERTKTLYQAEFGCEAPADLWPSSERRFGEDLAWRRVNTRAHWIIRKPRWRSIYAGNRSVWAMGCLLSAVGLALSGCATLRSTDPLVMLVMITAMVLAIALPAIAAARSSQAASKRSRRRRSSSDSSSDGGDSGAAYWPFWLGNTSSGSDHTHGHSGHGSHHGHGQGHGHVDHTGGDVGNSHGGSDGAGSDGGGSDGGGSDGGGSDGGGSDSGGGCGGGGDSGGGGCGGGGD